MQHNLLRLSFTISVLAAAATAQQVIATAYGTVANHELGTSVRGVGDIDGDGVGDFAVGEGNFLPPCHVYVISGATRATLVTMTGTDPGLGAYDINPIGDVDGDGKGDLAIGYASRQVVDVFSGATGARMYRLGPAIEYSGYVCGVGDYDGDGRADFAASVTVNNVTQIWVVRGLTGTQLGVVAATTNRNGSFLRNLGDITGDGLPEIASCGSTTEIYDLHPLRLLRTINLNPPSSNLVAAEAADMDRDGRKDVLLGFGSGVTPFLFVVSAVTGVTLRTMTAPPDDTNAGGFFSVLPDVDGDGMTDIVLASSFDPMDVIDPGHGVMAVMSGSDGHRIGAWSGTPQFSCNRVPVSAVGDVDGDGFGDFVIGNANLQSRRGGWQLISGRVLANMVDKPANCYSGPFAPQLGITRPVLGRSMTVAGRDAPAGALGIVVMSFLPVYRTNLGVVGCDAWFDPANWFLLAVPTAAPSWQFGVPLPNRRGLGGFEIAMQAIYLGTGTPLGLDLSNGVWARLGY